MSEKSTHIKDLFDQYLAWLPKLREASEKMEALEKKPSIKRQYENIEDYTTDAQALEDWKQKAAAIKNEKQAAEAKIRAIKSEIMKILPSEIWFKHGDIGIGISYTNWGGNNYNIEVKPWQEKMPSLDHRYRGD